MRVQVAEKGLSYARDGLTQQCTTPPLQITRGSNGLAHHEPGNTRYYHVGDHIEDLFKKDKVGCVYIAGELKFHHTGHDDQGEVVQVGGNVEQFLFAHGGNGIYFVAVVSTDGSQMEMRGRIQEMRVNTSIRPIGREWYPDTPELVIQYEDGKGRKHTTKIAVRDGIFGCAVTKEVPELRRNVRELEHIARSEIRFLENATNHGIAATRRH